MVIHGNPWISMVPAALSLGSFGAPAPLKGLGCIFGCHGVSTIFPEPRLERNSKKHVGLWMSSGSPPSDAMQAANLALHGQQTSLLNDGLVEGKSSRKPCCLFPNQISITWSLFLQMFPSTIFKHLQSINWGPLEIDSFWMQKASNSTRRNVR